MLPTLETPERRRSLLLLANVQRLFTAFFVLPFGSSFAKSLSMGGRLA